MTMKNKLKEEMLKEIFIQTGGRPENIKIADVCAEIAVKAISSNTMLAVSLPSLEELNAKANFYFPAQDKDDANHIAYKSFIAGAQWIVGEIKRRGNDR